MALTVVVSGRKNNFAILDHAVERLGVGGISSSGDDGSARELIGLCAEVDDANVVNADTAAEYLDCTCGYGGADARQICVKCKVLNLEAVRQVVVIAADDEIFLVSHIRTSPVQSERCHVHACADETPAR